MIFVPGANHKAAIIVVCPKRSLMVSFLVQDSKLSWRVQVVSAMFFLTVALNQRIISSHTRSTLEVDERYWR